jgi:hypothetical protein
MNIIDVKKLMDKDSHDGYFKIAGGKNFHFKLINKRGE